MTPRPSRAVDSARFPWYDSLWLTSYHDARRVVERVRPEALAGFDEALQVFRTPVDFEERLLTRVFDDETMSEIRKVIAALRPTDLELHEAKRFGRFVVHDRPYFSELQRQIEPLVSDTVGEPVESCYNFLSLYSDLGRCAVHMDAPQAKWTLDLCLDQSATWPICFSDVRSWPEPDDERWAPGSDWEAEIKRTNRFRMHELMPGEAVVFSGSSQWHYRDAIPSGEGRSFCDLLFFHFVPKGTRELVEPRNWARLFEISELDGLFAQPGS